MGIKKFIVRCSTEWSIQVQAENTEEAMDIASNIPMSEWGRADSEFEAEEDK